MVYEREQVATAHARRPSPTLPIRQPHSDGRVALPFRQAKLYIWTIGGQQKKGTRQRELVSGNIGSTIPLNTPFWDNVRGIFCNVGALFLGFVIMFVSAYRFKAVIGFMGNDSSLPETLNTLVELRHLQTRKMFLLLQSRPTYIEVTQVVALSYKLLRDRYKSSKLSTDRLALLLIGAQFQVKIEFGTPFTLGYILLSTEIAGGILAMIKKVGDQTWLYRAAGKAEKERSLGLPLLNRHKNIC
ncbi:hypothetical protein Tco_1052629 [Tanacetum coccineum]